MVEGEDLGVLAGGALVPGDDSRPVEHLDAGRGQAHRQAAASSPAAGKIARTASPMNLSTSPPPSAMGAHTVSK